MEDPRIEEIKDLLYKKYITSRDWCADVEVSACNAYAMLCMAQNGVSDPIIKVEEGNK